MSRTKNSDIHSLIDRLPEPLRRVCRDSVEQADKALLLLPEEYLESAMPVFTYSQFVVNSIQRYPDLLARLKLDSGSAVDELRKNQASLDLSLDETGFMSALRQFRTLEMVRIAWRDLAGWADLAEVMQTMSDLADGLTDRALQWAGNKLQQLHGKPIGEASGDEVRLVVMGLGKLGGCELNFSSDIDLMFAYAEEGQTDGKRPISNHEYFTRLGRLLIKLLGESTKDGFVFRVDMRLRPNGNSGPLALSFDAMEHYYQAHGRDWERYALIKMRPIAGDITGGSELVQTLRPFIFRKYLDFGAVDSIREMKLLINQELKRKGIDANVKLGPGGIREIEFIGQSFQLIRGGREPGLQCRSILRVLPLLVKNGQLTSQALTELEAAYDFLRRTEHRLQMIADQQTHVLPKDELNQWRVAYAMGYDDWQSFHAELQRHMRKVHEHFNQVFSAPQGEIEDDQAEPGLSSVWRGLVDAEQATEILSAHGYADPVEAGRLLAGLRNGRAYVVFSREGRERMDRLLPLLIAAAGLTEDSIVTLARLIKLIEAIGRRSAYFVLLTENPLALSQLVKLCSASAWISDWISQHPVVMDELIDAASLYQSATIEQLHDELAIRLQRVDTDDLDAQMNTLREFHHAQVLRVAAVDVGPGLEPAVIGERLSNIAEVILRASFEMATASMVARHGRPECTNGSSDDLPFIIIAYGKLGGRELGYSSDLDLTFLYGDCKTGGMTSGGPGIKPIANETYFARLGQKLIHILNIRTSAGTLYEVDMRLRPSGKSGALVTSLSSFENYQLKKAWVWEHQALVRARSVVGPGRLRQQFLEIRNDILCKKRDSDELRQEIVSMREKMRETQEISPEGQFNLKHDHGGIVDIEFIVQYGVLQCAHEFPDLTRSTNNHELLSELVKADFMDATQCATLQTSYLYYLHLEYRRKLLGKKSIVQSSQIKHSPDRVIEIWQHLFGPSEQQD